MLVLEDLHWGDYATVDLLSWLARRREPARLLRLGTYRPVEVILRAHPLGTVKHDLEMHGQCAELALELLTEAEVGQYLVARFGVPQPPPPWVTLLYQRTDGLPLFLVTLVDYLEAQGALLLAQESHRPRANGISLRDAEASFHQALAVARQQSAKSLELRTAVSLGRLWQTQGKRNAAHHLLAEVHGTFTEVFDTPDLQEAWVLLASLS